MRTPSSLYFSEPSHSDSVSHLRDFQRDKRWMAAMRLMKVPHKARARVAVLFRDMRIGKERKGKPVTQQKRNRAWSFFCSAWFDDKVLCKRFFIGLTKKELPHSRHPPGASLFPEKQHQLLTIAACTASMTNHDNTSLSRAQTASSMSSGNIHNHGFTHVPRFGPGLLEYQKTDRYILRGTMIVVFITCKTLYFTTKL